MLEAMVAMGSSSSASGIAGDGSWRLLRLANGEPAAVHRSKDTLDNWACWRFRSMPSLLKKHPRQLGMLAFP